MQARLQAARTAAANSASGMARPAFVFNFIGNTHTGLTVSAFNSRPLPDETIVSAAKYSNGSIVQMTWTEFIGEMPASLFDYPLENGLRTNWTDETTFTNYEIVTFFPDGTETFSFLIRPRHKIGGILIPIQRMVTGCTATFSPAGIFALVTGPIAQHKENQIGVLIKDPDSRFDQRPAEYRVVGDVLRVNLRNPDFIVAPGNDITIMVVGPDGRADQCTTIVKQG